MATRFALILLFALLTAGAVRPANWGRPRPTGPDLILVSLDAVRADRLGSYGYASATTPALDRLAEEAVLFRRAYCQEPWTLTSHMSMLTGLQPDAHGLDFGRALSPAIWTLPEQLQDAGYRTWGSVYDCYLLDPGFGYGAGFDHYEVSGIPAAERVERALTWLAQDERPSFLFLHLYDPHSDTGVLPYEAPKELLEQFAPGAAQAFDAWTGRGGASESLRLVNEGEMELPEPLRAAIGQLYDAGLAATDAAVGRFLNGLRASGRFDDALILVLSDHGESLGERNHFMHEQLMEATLRIPFLLKWPGGRDAGSLRDELVETVDVAPTFLAAAGLEPPALVQGIDLHRAPADWPRRAVLSRSGPDYALTTVDSLRILHRWTNAAAELSEIRRIGADPSDGEPLPGNPYEIAYPWLEMLEALHHSNRIVADRFRGVEVQANAADQDLLRSLGYVD